MIRYFGTPLGDTGAVVFGPEFDMGENQYRYMFRRKEVCVVFNGPCDVHDPQQWVKENWPRAKEALDKLECEDKDINQDGLS